MSYSPSNTINDLEYCEEGCCYGEMFERYNFTIHKFILAYLVQQQVFW